MRITKIDKAQTFSSAINTIAADKSISHRCAIFSLLCDGVCEVENYLLGEDTLHTLKIAFQLGLEVEHISSTCMRFIPPKDGIVEPSDVLDCGNAGTGMRLYAGLLAGVQGYFVLSGDMYLNKRPMKRIIEPLTNIGAKIYGRCHNSLAPLSIIGRELQGFSYVSNIASAQVKSAMILAGLYSNTHNTFSEPLLSRDHTERMLGGMGVEFRTHHDSNGIHISFDPLPKGKKLHAFKMRIPADPSSAFYFALAACIVPDSHVVLENVLLNPTRIEAFEILKKMGAKISYTRKDSQYEDIGDIEVRYAPLSAIEVAHNIAWLIDEIPALSIAFACAKGKSIVRNAKELRVKESDRITTTIEGLRAMGIECEEFEDGFSVQGGELKRASVDSQGDHRIAMSFAIAGLVCGVEIRDSACIDVSFPNFLEILLQFTRVESTQTHS
ncbi:3-phosphoshikimate 1-carboxyvinyltransferase [uncultured Helicobacter sp.]|uniref:3-phosphoshikimate 1-carboxyvinyltransferase n=1 Tax=Helicobacter sp. TaxID=218 RepID=UPI002A7AB933|nr:3-phosphoshikimate 1-carboxyvinyltransferase [Helicobacter sp.]MDY2823883.1 3-phosphoshikimate 1-carboxyvinyltransferase [Helicobacter sp.]